ncbi:MAG TPA: ATP-binding protein [Cryobacterium sp.]|nr:ATP-binding protein [Cryobacterium sp.]
MTPDIPAERDELAIEGDSLSVRKIGPWLRDRLDDGLPADEASEIASRLELAVHEVAMNMVDHARLPASALLRFRATVTDTVVEISVTDPGEPFDPGTEKAPTAGTPQERGYGLMIVRRLVDHLGYTRLDAGNRWTLRVNRTSPADPGTPEVSTTHD